MRTYWVKTPAWLPKCFPKSLVWKMPRTPAVYLTFDDGPHPEATPLVLDLLKKYQAKATFFCIGKNVALYPDLFQRIKDEGHTFGNHTYNHLNGWRNENSVYLQNILKAQRLIPSSLFRPPYGRIKLSQARILSKRKAPWTVYMWDVLSGDFDTTLSPSDCINNVIENAEQGSIIVFHDSEKALPRMKEALPTLLEFCQQKNWELKPLPTQL
ncbi:MAG: polysaccharide deacetylase family protein [Bacteroidetes bacterium]|nr:polysaccharide deacetylase family protein [Bacteroidota bacterium]